MINYSVGNLGRNLFDNIKRLTGVFIILMIISLGLVAGCDDSSESTSCEKKTSSVCDGKYILVYNDCDSQTPIDSIYCGNEKVCRDASAVTECVACDYETVTSCNEDKTTLLTIDSCGNTVDSTVCGTNLFCVEDNSGASCESCTQNDDIVCGADGKLYNQDSCGNIGSLIAGCDNIGWCDCLGDVSNGEKCAAYCAECTEINDICQNGDVYSAIDCNGETRISGLAETCIYGSCEVDSNGAYCSEDCSLSGNTSCGDLGTVLKEEECNGSGGLVTRDTLDSTCDTPFDICKENGGVASCNHVAECHNGKAYEFALKGKGTMSEDQIYCAEMGMRMATISEIRADVLDNMCSYVMPGGQCNTGSLDYNVFSTTVNLDYCSLGPGCDANGGSLDYFCDGNYEQNMFLNSFFSVPTGCTHMLRSGTQFSNYSKAYCFNMNNADIVAKENQDQDGKPVCVIEEARCQ